MHGKFVILFSLLFQVVQSVSKLDFALLEATATADSFDIIVSFKSNQEQVRANILLQTFSRPSQRRQSLFNALQTHAERSQRNLLRTVQESHKRSRLFRTTTFWATNQLGIQGADRNLLKTLENSADVASVQLDRKFTLDIYPQDQSPFKGHPQHHGETHWNLKQIHVEDVWDRGIQGEGIVVANIDTGVRGTHEALREKFRTENGWFDPVFFTRSPADVVGHGTGTMGIILGEGLGVAPRAKWIACNAFDDNLQTSYSLLLSCAQFVVCPTNATGGDPRCDLAPRIVSNSWGIPYEYQIYEVFEEMIKLWTDAGIIPVFAAGNQGPMCGTVASPGDSPQVISVGATNFWEQVSFFSSRGPIPSSGDIKPDIVAPGQDVITAHDFEDDAYTYAHGTSFAAPHAAGMVALMLSHRPDLTMEQVRNYLVDGARPGKAINGTCGGIPDRVFPNPIAGNGIISAKGTFSLLS